MAVVRFQIYHDSKPFVRPRFSAAFKDFNVRNLFVDVGSFDSEAGDSLFTVFFFYFSMLPFSLLMHASNRAKHSPPGRVCIDRERERKWMNAILREIRNKIVYSEFYAIFLVSIRIEDGNAS